MGKKAGPVDENLKFGRRKRTASLFKDGKNNEDIENQ
jgi:hypothetical protein